MVLYATVDIEYATPGEEKKRMQQKGRNLLSNQNAVKDKNDGVERGAVGRGQGSVYREEEGARERGREREREGEREWEKEKGDAPASLCLPRSLSFSTTGEGEGTEEREGQRLAREEGGHPRG